MTYYEPLSLGSESIIDPYANQLLQLRRLINEEVADKTAKYNLLSNALFTDRDVFPEWLLTSRYWLSTILVYDKPTIHLQPAGIEGDETHKAVYRFVEDYYRRTLDRGFQEEVSATSKTFQLRIIRDTYDVVFKSWRIVDASVTLPPFISVNRPINE